MNDSQYLILRCNQFENCADGSDERDCKSLVIKSNNFIFAPISITHVICCSISFPTLTPSILFSIISTLYTISNSQVSSLAYAEIKQKLYLKSYSCFFLKNFHMYVFFIRIVLDNYNRKIPPFRLDPSTNEIKKADVNISVDVVDMLSLTEV